MSYTDQYQCNNVLRNEDLDSRCQTFRKFVLTTARFFRSFAEGNTAKTLADPLVKEI